MGSGIFSEDFIHVTARTVHYEGGAVASHARSLWRLETLRVVYVPCTSSSSSSSLSQLCFERVTWGGSVCWCLWLYVSRWSGSHIRWGQPFRLRHVTTGKYLSLTDDKSLLLMDKEKADVKSTAFCFRSSKVRSGSLFNPVPHASNERWPPLVCVSERTTSMNGTFKASLGLLLRPPCINVFMLLYRAIMKNYGCETVEL